MLGSVSVQPSQPGSSRVNKWGSFCCCFPLQGVQGRLCNPSRLHTPCPSCNTPVKPCLRRLSNMLAGASGCSRASPALCHPINIAALTPVKRRRALKRPPGLSSPFSAATRAVGWRTDAAPQAGAHRRRKLCGSCFGFGDAVAVDAGGHGCGSALALPAALRISARVPLVPLRAQQSGSYVSVELKLKSLADFGFICIGYICIPVFTLKETLMKEAGTQSQ